MSSTNQAPVVLGPGSDAKQVMQALKALKAEGLEQVEHERACERIRRSCHMARASFRRLVKITS